MLYAQLGDLRTMVSTGVATVPSFATRLSAALGDYSADYGEVVPVTGVLSGSDGSPLAGEQVEVQVNGDGRWITSRLLTTAPDGTFVSDLKPRKRLYVRLRFPGRTELRRAYSSRLLLRLRPVITLRRPRSRGVRGVAVPVAGTIGPRKRVVRVLLQQHTRGRYRTVGKKFARVRRGRFRTSFVPGFRDRYRYAVIAVSDDDTDRGSTGWLPLRVR
jgi:hypothetical protein